MAKRWFRWYIASLSLGKSLNGLTAGRRVSGIFELHDCWVVDAWSSFVDIAFTCQLYLLSGKQFWGKSVKVKLPKQQHIYSHTDGGCWFVPNTVTAYLIYKDVYLILLTLYIPYCYRSQESGEPGGEILIPYWTLLDSIGVLVDYDWL